MAYKDKSNAIKYNNNFIKEAYDRINLTVPKGRKAELQAAAERHGQSVNGFINGLIDEAMKREQSPGRTQRSTGTPKRDEYTGPGSAEWWAQRTPGGTTEGAEQFPYFPDDEETPQAAVGTSPMEDEESSPAEQLFPDDWEEDEKDLPWW